MVYLERADKAEKSNIKELTSYQQAIRETCVSCFHKEITEDVFKQRVSEITTEDEYSVIDLIKGKDNRDYAVLAPEPIDSESFLKFLSELEENNTILIDDILEDSCLLDVVKHTFEKFDEYFIPIYIVTIVAKKDRDKLDSRIIVRKR